MKLKKRQYSILWSATCWAIIWVGLKGSTVTLQEVTTLIQEVVPPQAVISVLSVFGHTTQKRYYLLIKALKKCCLVYFYPLLTG